MAVASIRGSCFWFVWNVPSSAICQLTKWLIWCETWFPGKGVSVVERRKGYLRLSDQAALLSFYYFYAILVINETNTLNILPVFLYY